MQSIVAYRVLALLYSGRVNKNKSIKTLISEQEWQIYKRLLFPNHRRAPEKISLWIERIAQYGGFIKGKGRNPGILTLWEGWTRLNIVFNGVQVAAFTK